MKLSDSQYPLKKVFYRMFSLLVVVPLIVVFAAAAVILYQVMRTSAVDTISAFQETVATTLNTDIKSASLQLSHFVYVNDGEFLDVANRVYSSSGSSQQYLAAKELERSFNTAMVPSQNILAGLFFMKGGGTVPVKESITLPDDALRAELRRRIFADGGTAAAPAAGPQLAPGSYGVAVFAVDDMARQSDRFGGDLKNRLDKPMLELVRQIPRVAGRATLRAAGPGQYELLWQVRDKAPVCAPLLNALGAQRDEDYEAEKEAFFRTREPLDGPAQTQLMLVLLTQITEAQRKCGLDAENTAGCEAVVQALGTPWERSVWLRKERERLQHRSRSQTPDPIRRAQIFLEDNFTDHNLTLKAVADQVGLNEKYLSTQFTRRCGCTFISYLNNLRLRYAQELLARTDLKIYEISDRVGYSRFPRLLPI